MIDNLVLSFKKWRCVKFIRKPCCATINCKKWRYKSKKLKKKIICVSEVCGENEKKDTYVATQRRTKNGEEESFF